MTEVLDLVPAVRESIQSDGAAIVRRASELVVCDADSYGVASDIAKDAKARIAIVRENMDPIVASAHETHKRLTKMRGDLISPFESAINVVNGKRQAFDYEQERLRRAEQDRLRKEAEAEAARIRAAEVAAAKKQAEELEAKSRAALADGNAELAKGLATLAKDARAETRVLKAEPLQVVVPVVADTRPVVEGTSRRVTHKARVFDMRAFLTDIASRAGDWPLVEVTAELNRRAAKFGQPGRGNMLPGVEIYAETSYADKRGTW